MTKLSSDQRNSYTSSKTQSPAQLSLGSSHGTGYESALLTDNFKELLLDPVDIQLKKLLGSEAEDFCTRHSVKEPRRHLIQWWWTENVCNSFDVDLLTSDLWFFQEISKRKQRRQLVSL